MDAKEDPHHVSRSSMYLVADEDSNDTSNSSEDNEEDVETVKTAAAATATSDDILINFHPNPEEDEDTTTAGDNEGEDEDDIEEFFNEIFPDRNRLDTVEEVTEPMSSFVDSLPPDQEIEDFDLAKLSNSGQPSSDFQNDSLPPDKTSSLTSKEEVYSTSEVEIWPSLAEASTSKPPLLSAIERSVSGQECNDKESSEDNSLSISLPSEGSQKQAKFRLELNQVRTGILKIFDDAEKNDVDTVDHVGAFDAIAFDEKHEFERTEKMIQSKSSINAWSLEEAQNISQDNDDSGIDRAGSRVSIGSSGGKVWNKIQKQINRRFGGSTGSLSSTTSPNSEKIVPSNAQQPPMMDSPPEGGFQQANNEPQSVAIMKAHIKELKAQLAKAEEDKEKIAQVAYQKAMDIKAEADKRLNSAHLSQMKQANLIDRLKSKLEEYKKQCHTMETRLIEVNQLANLSQVQLGDTTEVLQSLEERLKMTEERHFAEVKALQVRLEEQQEKNHTLNHVNAELRAQLETSENTNQQLSLDLQKLTAHWENLKQSETKQSSHSNESAHVAQMWNEVLAFRRQMLELKMSTQRDLNSMKNDLSSAGKKVTSACLDVHANSDYIKINGRETRIGTQQELWTQLQRCRVEKKVLEQKVTSLEEKMITIKSKHHSLEQSMLEEQRSKLNLLEENDQLVKKSKQQEEEISQLHELSYQNNILEGSLMDIAQMVANEDEDANTDVVDLAINTQAAFSTPKPLLKRAESPALRRKVESIERRRTRSASPAITETTLSAVQTTLHKRQLQIQDLRSRLANTTAKMAMLQSNLQIKEDIIKNTSKLLEKEKMDADSFKLKFEEVTREKSILQERIEATLGEKSHLERSKESLQQEISSITKEKALLGEAHARAMHELKNAQGEIDRLEASNKKLNKEAKERLNLISQLEQVGSSLRNELMITKEELSNLQKKKMEFKRDSSTSFHEEFSMHEASSSRKELEMEANMSKLEKSQSLLKTKCLNLETSISKIQEEKVRLTMEVNEARTSNQTLKDQLVAKEHKITQIEAEMKSKEEQYKATEDLREKLESNLRFASSQKEELDNQLISVILQKEALQDEVAHMKREMQELRSNLDRISVQNGTLNREKNELFIRVESVTKDFERLDLLVNSLKSEKGRFLEQIDDLNLDLDDAVNQVEKWKNSAEEAKAQSEALSKQMKALKRSMEDEIARAELEKARLLEEQNDIKESMEKALNKLKLELIEAENDAFKHREAIKASMEQEHRVQLTKVTKEKEEIAAKLQFELEEALASINALKQNHIEEVMMTENDKQQALTMAQQEFRGLSERLSETVADLEETKKELDKQRREAGSKLERDRTSINELQMELSKLKGLLQDKTIQLERETSTLSASLSKEKQDRLEMESECDLLRSSLKKATEQFSKLEGELLEVRRKLEETSEAKQQVLMDLTDTEKRLDESKLQVERLDQLKNSLKETVAHLEEDKELLGSDLNRVKSKSRQMEESLYSLRQELESTRHQCDNLKADNAEYEEQMLFWQSQHQSLLSEHKELEIHFDNIRAQQVAEDDLKSKESRELQNLRLRISELESSKSMLEKELSNAKSQASVDLQAWQTKVSTLTQTLEEIRGRERKLEDQRHNLEICYNNSQQQVKDLQVKLNGQDGRLGELFATVAKLESAKKEAESKLSSIATLLHHVRSSSNTRSRPPTPTRTRQRRSSSTTSYSESAEVDIEQVRSDVRDLVSRISLAVKERDEALHQVVSLKRQNGELLENTSNLEDQVDNQRKRSKSFEEALRKLENRVAQSDANVATQEEKLSIREQELRELSGQLRMTKDQLETLRKSHDSVDFSSGKSKNQALSFDTERRKLQAEIKDLETRLSRLEVAKRGLESENNRLLASLGDKEKEVQNLKSKCDNLGRGVAHLEDKCTELNVTVDSLNSHLEKSLKNEHDLQERVSDLNQSISAKNSHNYEAESHVAKLERQLEKTKHEKNLLEDQLEASQNSLQDTKKRMLSLEQNLEEVELALQKSASRANHLELALEASKASLESSSPDNYIKEELSRMRRENDALQDKLKDMTRKLTMLESDKRDLERKLLNSSNLKSPLDQPDHVRSQIPLLGGKIHHQHAHSEHYVKIRLLEQENERLLRKIRGLEQQLSELEILHGKRVQELLQDRRKEREKESQRQRESVRHMEATQSSREKIFKERIYGLEQQVGVLKDQLNKELRRRQVFIMESSGIANEITELRHHLDQSLQTVNSSTDGRTLDREAGRLNLSVDRYGPDYVSRLTPSKLGRLTASTPHLGPKSSSYSTRRTLHFDDSS